MSNIRTHFQPALKVKITKNDQHKNTIQNSKSLQSCMDSNGTGDHVLVRRANGVVDIAVLVAPAPIVVISPSVPLSVQWYKTACYTKTNQPILCNDKLDLH